MSSDIDESNAPMGMTRRTIVRTAANATWAAPVIVMASTAPAFAASSRVWVQTFTAAYVNQGNASTVRPDQLLVNATIQNTGPNPTSGVTFTLRIPRAQTGGAAYPFGVGGNLYDSQPTVADPAGWTSSGTFSTVSGTNYSHEIVFTATTGTQVPAGGTKAFSATIQFTDGVNTSPYKAWAGTPFTLQGTAADPDTNVNPAPFTTAVASSTQGTLTMDDFQAERDSPLLSTPATLEVWCGNSGGQAARNTSRKTCGPITFAISWTKSSTHRYYASNPTAVSTEPAGWGTVAYTVVGTLVTLAYTSTMAATAPVASGATAANSGSADFRDSASRHEITLVNEGTFSGGSTGSRNITGTATATSVSSTNIVTSDA